MKLKLSKILVVMASIAVLVSSMSGCAGKQKAERYQATYLDMFDTACTIMGYAASQDEFDAAAETIHQVLLEYHRLCDIYHEYPGINNIKTINDNAGKSAVEVDKKLIEFLLFCKDMEKATDGAVNIAMGSILSIWHDAREAASADPASAAVPEMTRLEIASLHDDIDLLVIDEAASTVYLEDVEMSLDVGALAKGYALEQVSELVPAGYLLNLGGNVKAFGPKVDGSPWSVGIRDPKGDDGSYLCTVKTVSESVVTSGDYQRYFEAAGRRWHHIISPDTLHPSVYWSSVSIVCEDSGVADALSTALFILPLEAGESLLLEFSAEAIWVAPDGTEYRSEGFKTYEK